MDILLNLILVDDEPWALAGLQTIIDWNAYGYKIIDCCDSGDCAVNSIIKNKPDVVFTDIRMSDMTGMDLIVKIRESGLNTEFVIVSAYSDFSVAQEAIRYNARRYLIKPLDSSEVADVAAEIARQLNSRTDSAVKEDDDMTREALKGGFLYSDNQTVAQIQYYLSKHFSEENQLKELAKTFFLSETYLCDIFKKHTGTTISSFLRKNRINRAKYLLSETDSVLNIIGENVGYNEYSYFGKVFKAETGFTPEEYRKTKGGQRNDK